MPRSSPRQPLRVALIGQRFMGRAHANAWRQAGRFFELSLEPVLRAVAGRDGEELARFAERWGFERALTDWRLLAADPELELVDIATPNHLHAPQALAMLAAGKVVACEKPLAGTLEDARAMRDAAASAARPTCVWFNYRRCPAVGLAWKLAREGFLGELRHVRARYLQDWGGPETPHSWRFRRAEAGSGAHGDLNAHSVDLARFLAGEELVSVQGALAATFVERRASPEGGTAPCDVDDSLAFLARFASGATASFEASRLATGQENDNAIELYGSRGSLRFRFEDMNALELFEGGSPPRTSGWKRVPCTTAGAHPWVEAWWPPGHPLGYEHGFTNTAADLLRVLAGEEPELPLCDFADAYETQRVLEAASRAAREGRAVPLEEVS